MKEISRSGNLMYEFKTVEKIPTIRDSILHTERYKVFIDSVTLNPKNVNAQLYSQFTDANYRSFIYAFAVQLGRLYSTSVGRQFEMNARRVERLCKKRNITLSQTETNVIDVCKNFTSLTLIRKEKTYLSQKLCSELVDNYPI